MLNQIATATLLSHIVVGIQHIKGENITVLDLREIENSACDYFVICNANSNTQVTAIANSVEKNVRNELKDRPWHVEGLNNSQWVLIDYISIVVHVFQKEYRAYYDIESLWGDAKVTLIKE